MADKTHTGPDSGVSSVWTGQIDFELMNGRNWRVAIVVLVVGIDTITVQCNDLNLADMSRNSFQEWLIQPQRALIIDDIIWTTRDHLTCITIHNGLTYAIPPAVATQLRTVI